VPLWILSAVSSPTPNPAAPTSRDDGRKDGDRHHEHSGQAHVDAPANPATAATTKTAAMSLLMASILTVSATAATMTLASPVFPVEAAWAAPASTVTTVSAPAPAKKAAPAPAPAKKAAPSPAPAPAPALAKEEKERLVARKNLDLSQQTLKEYQKYVSDSKQADKKASGELAAASKAAEAAKKQYVAMSDKLSKAKSQKMPSTAIQELTVNAGTLLFLAATVSE
jgi:hypothetical protein